MADVCVLGLGYIGLPTALLMASSGFQVHGMDIDQQRVEQLSRGNIVPTEPGVASLVSEVVTEGLLSFDNQIVEAEAYIIAVPTPLSLDNTPDLEAVVLAGRSVVPFLRKGSLVVLESTVPVGTTEQILVPVLNQGELQAGEDFAVAFCPERAMPGNLLHELRNNPRVIGGLTSQSADQAAALYSHFVTGAIYKTDLRTAEMVKLMENTYRDVNIALANEMALLADAEEVNIWEARQLANLHPRVNIHKPGPGVGGHCLPVDPYFLQYTDPDNAPLISVARAVNDQMPAFVADKVKNLLRDGSRKVAVLGVTYKSGTDDARNSPAAPLKEHLTKHELEVVLTDPVVQQFRGPVERFEEAIGDADLLVFLVDHEQYRRLDPRHVAQMTKARIVIDTRNFLDCERWQQAGFAVYSLGAGRSRQQ